MRLGGRLFLGTAPGLIRGLAADAGEPDPRKTRPHGTPLPKSAVGDPEEGELAAWPRDHLPAQQRQVVGQVRLRGSLHQPAGHRENHQGNQHQGHGGRQPAGAESQQRFR